jgi:hypothetical protein
MPTVDVLYFALPYPFTSLPPFFNSFNTSLYPLPLHLMICDITDALERKLFFGGGGDEDNTESSILWLEPHLQPFLLCFALDF